MFLPILDVIIFVSERAEGPYRPNVCSYPTMFNHLISFSLATQVIRPRGFSQCYCHSFSRAGRSQKFRWRGIIC